MQARFENENAVKEKRTTLDIREINDNNILLFKMCLSEYTWAAYVDGNNAQDMYSIFHGELMEVYNNCVPEKRKWISNNINISWKTEEIQNIKNKLDALQTMYKVTKSENILQIYNNCKKEYIHLIKNTRKEKNQEYILQSNNKQQAIWDIIKKETGRNNKLTVNESKLTGSELNEYFVSVGKTTAESVIANDDDDDVATFLKNFKDNCTNTCFLFDTTSRELVEIARQLKSKKSKDIYGMTTIVLKGIVELLAEPLVQIINACLQEGIFPQELKLAKVIPIHKKDDNDKDNASNYRPISVLPVISKILEMIIKNRIVTFLEKYNFFTEAQHGYRSGRSTITAMIEMVENVLEARDNKLSAEIMACDLSKAFDCVSHSILLQKLWYYGIRGNAYDLLKSYLNNRKQCVWWNNTLSELRDLEIGVPQGSILGPLLFIIYVNDMPNNISGGRVYAYADDTSILVRGTKEEVESMRENALRSAETWFRINKLKINTDKTQTLVFGTRKETTMNFLGISVDAGLTWRSHIDSLCAKLSKAIYTIRAIKAVSTKEAAKHTYYANFHNVAAYGIMVWGMSPDTERVQILQKKAVRTLCGMEYRESCRETFKLEKILTITSIYILSCVKFVHANQSHFKKNTDLHEYGTRNRDNFVVPHHRLSVTQRGVDYWGVKMYNHLPNEVKTLNKNKFAKLVKELLLRNTLYNLKEYFDILL